MFSTMITVASTMMPKSMAPIDSRFADSPLSTRMTTANSSAKGMVAETISALRRLPRNSHWIRKISVDAHHHVVQHGVGGDVDQRAAVVDALDADAGRQDAGAVDLLDLGQHAGQGRQGLRAAPHQHDALDDVVVVVLAGDAEPRLVAHRHRARRRTPAPACRRAPTAWCCGCRPSSGSGRPSARSPTASRCSPCWRRH